MPKKSRRCVKGGRGKNRSKKQNFYNMKGCSKSRSKSRSLKGGSHGPIAPYSWKQMQQQGGSCASCGLSPMTGGSFYQPASPIPGPFVGQAWAPSVAGWPGVNGIGGDSNYLANNLYKGPDAQTMMQLGGKKRRKKGKKSLRGGGIMPQDLVNLGRDASFNFKSAYNAINGYAAPTNSLPYKDQLSGSMSANRIIV